MWCIGQVRLTKRAPISGKPSRSALGKTDQPMLPVVFSRFEEAGTTGGPGESGANPSVSGVGRCTTSTSPKTSTLLRIPAGRVIQGLQDVL